jgi:hypothetical protein
MDWNVYALDARSGWVVWRTRTGGPIVSSPTMANGMVFIGSADKHMYALDARNGRELWKFQMEGQVTLSPAYANGAVYFDSIDHYVYSLDAETGELRWRFITGGTGHGDRSPGLVKGVQTSQQDQFVGLGRLHTQAQTVDPQTAQRSQPGCVQRGGVGCEADLGVGVHDKGVATGRQQVCDRRHGQNGRCAAPKKDGRDALTAARAPHLVRQSGGVGGEEVFQAGVGVKVAVSTTPPTEGDV